VNAESHAFTQLNRETANHTPAIASGNFTSLDAALEAAEQRRVALPAELVKLDGSQ
jgi:hypothetical protein